MARKQKELPGMEKQTIKEIDTAAEAYVDARDARMKKTEKEVDAKDALIAAMQKHKVNVYRDETANLVVVLKPGKDNVRVTSAEDEPGEDDEVEEDEKVN